MAPDRLVRFGVSVEKKLFDEFEQVIQKKGYTNRSEAIRDLMRDFLLREQLSRPGDSEEVIGTISLVYNHRVRDLTDRLTDLQHEYHGNIISNLHVHLDYEKCLEVLVAKGKFPTLREISGRLISIKGVLTGKLFTSEIIKK